MDEIVANIEDGRRRGKKHSIIILAEGVMEGHEFADKLYKILFHSDFEINHDFIKKFNSEKVVLNKYKNLFNKILNK